MLVRLVDIFGDNRMISVVICRPLGNETWEVDTWLMSCRVLGRKAEAHWVLRENLEHALRRWHRMGNRANEFPKRLAKTECCPQGQRPGERH